MEIGVGAIKGVALCIGHDGAVGGLGRDARHKLAFRRVDIARFNHEGSLRVLIGRDGARRGRIDGRRVVDRVHRDVDGVAGRSLPVAHADQEGIRAVEILIGAIEEIALRIPHDGAVGWRGGDAGHQLAFRRIDIARLDDERGLHVLIGRDGARGGRINGRRVVDCGDGHIDGLGDSAALAVRHGDDKAVAAVEIGLGRIDEGTVRTARHRAIGGGACGIAERVAIGVAGAHGDGCGGILPGGDGLGRGRNGGRGVLAFPAAATCGRGNSGTAQQYAADHQRGGRHALAAGRLGSGGRGFCVRRASRLLLGAARHFGKGRCLGSDHGNLGIFRLHIVSLGLDHIDIDGRRFLARHRFRSLRRDIFRPDGRNRRLGSHQRLAICRSQNCLGFGHFSFLANRVYCPALLERFGDSLAELYPQRRHGHSLAG